MIRLKDPQERTPRQHILDPQYLHQARMDRTPSVHLLHNRGSEFMPICDRHR